MYAISPIRHCAATSARRAIVQPRRQRVLLRHWGFTAQEAASLLPDLPGLDGRLDWSVDARAEQRVDLVVHLVDATRLSGISGGARWNAMGPVDAMERAWRRGSSEVALVLGSTLHLPQDRRGCWILSGAHSLAGALHVIARTMVEPMLTAPAERLWNIHDLAATNALCILSREKGPDRDTLARRLTAAITTALNFSHAAPGRLAVAAETGVVNDTVSLNPLMRDRLRLFRRRPCTLDLTAEILVAYPWPAPSTDWPTA
ncbi:hypothetical protein LMG23992_02243 [Cupriavidus laharis]|uniref:Uncharacterized protein n=1 Tax=Cupriavidus laharis TaxID=151654 RepID=A0ABM8WY31_9BURK|nr:hypothetical protein [Cupriavidus laharis]CAG9172470.1 hypothetical protein LMG23992_02243 [Cupriavidus laharis]